MVAKYEHILPEGWRSTFVFSRDQIESIRFIWEKMQAEEPCPAINANIDRYLSVLEASEDQSTPLILLLEQNDQPKAMLIGRREKHAMAMRIGYKTLLRPKLHCMTLVYGGVLGQPNEEVSSLLVRELMRFLKQGEVDIIYFNHLQVDSAFYRQVRQISSLLCRNHFPVIEPHWRMSIPPNIEDFYASRSKKHRKHFRQYQNALEKQFPGQVRMHTYRTPEEVIVAIRDAATISKNTYQSKLRIGFMDNAQKHQLLQTAARKGWFRGHILYLNEEPAAFRFALCYNRACFGDGIGYDPKWKHLRVGTILFIKVLEELCQKQAVDYYDFGFGDADYKQSYATESWLEAAATYIFAPRFYPGFINLVNSLNTGLTLGLAWFLRKTRVFAWVKRAWRRKLQKTNEPKSDDD